LWTICAALPLVGCHSLRNWWFIAHLALLLRGFAATPPRATSCTLAAVSTTRPYSPHLWQRRRLTPLILVAHLSPTVGLAGRLPHRPLPPCYYAAPHARGSDISAIVCRARPHCALTLQAGLRTRVRLWTPVTFSLTIRLPHRGALYTHLPGAARLRNIRARTTCRTIYTAPTTPRFTHRTLHAARTSRAAHTCHALRTKGAPDAPCFFYHKHAYPHCTALPHCLYSLRGRRASHCLAPHTPILRALPRRTAPHPHLPHRLSPMQHFPGARGCAATPTTITHCHYRGLFRLYYLDAHRRALHCHTVYRYGAAFERPSCHSGGVAHTIVQPRYRLPAPPTVTVCSGWLATLPPHCTPHPSIHLPSQRFRC